MEPLTAVMVLYRGTPATIARPSSITFLQPLAGWPITDPAQRFAFGMSLFAIDVIEGNLPGPYTDERAAFFARALLIPDEDFNLELSDEQLAARLHVPAEEVTRRRAERDS